MSKRELIDTGTDKRYVRRDENGQFKESVDVGRSPPTSGKRQSRWPNPERAIRAITAQRNTEGVAHEQYRRRSSPQA